MAIIRCPHCGHELTIEEAKHISRVYAGSCTSEKKALSSAENGRKYAGRPKGVKNYKPRSDKGVKRGPISKTRSDKGIKRGPRKISAEDISNVKEKLSEV